jgi:5-methylcytosine-specific restriction endonuclease McrA
MGARPPFERRVVTGMALKVAQARKRRLHHAQTWDGITDEEILERDGWRCQIPDCGRRPIRKDVKYPHPRSKSIDHIIPLAHGGDDTAVNKRAAHLGCNLARGDKMGDEQVALFGSLREPPLATMTAGERAVMFQKRKHFCACGAVPVKNRKLCQRCLDQREAEAEVRRAERAERAPSTPIDYYTCRYCGKLGVVRASALSGRGRREVCDARECQLARLTVNNMIARKGIPREQADAIVTDYRAEGDHRQWRWSPTINAIGHDGGQGDPDPTGFANDPARWSRT